MTDDIIKMKLKEVGLSYTLTPKYFQIAREKKMSDNKAPKWFSDWSTEFVEFRESVNKRFDNLESRMDTIESKVDKNTDMILKLETKVDKNTDMILKAHPEFKK